MEVLFVDDDEANLVVWDAALGQEFGVLCANSGDRALELLREHKVAVIVADQRMPGMTGVELLERVEAEFPETIRILITAYAELAVAVQAINRGNVRRYLRKPCAIDELRGEIRNAMDLYDLRTRAAAMERTLMTTGRVYALGLIAKSLGHELSGPANRASMAIAQARSGAHALRESLLCGAHGSDLRTKAEEIDEWLRSAQEAALRVVEMAKSMELPACDGTDDHADIAEVLRLSLRLVRGELRRGGEIELDVHPVPLVKGNVHKLGQVVLNLIASALDAVAEKPENESLITIRLRSKNERVVLEILDNGPQMKDEDIRHAFRGFQVSSDARGASVGLGVARTLVDEVGGRLEAENREEGGATVRLLLPVYANGATTELRR